jgi:hypothetical protein
MREIQRDVAGSAYQEFKFGAVIDVSWLQHSRTYNRFKTMNRMTDGLRFRFSNSQIR